VTDTADAGPNSPERVTESPVIGKTLSIHHILPSIPRILRTYLPQADLHLISFNCYAMNIKNLKSGLILLAILLCFGRPLFAQNNPVGISGVVRDLQNKAQDRTTVVLQNETDTTVKITRVADAKGAFFFDNLPGGFYRIACSHIGFQVYKLSHLAIDVAHPAIQLPVIILQASNSQTLSSTPTITSA
jgi:hypothetical protein